MRLAELLDGRPFYAGVVVAERGRLLLSVRHGVAAIPDHPPGASVHMRWVGGGREGAETAAETARREAREELAVEVELVHAPTTWSREPPGRARALELADRPAPLLHERWANGDAVLFGARVLGVPSPGDVPALAWAPFAAVGRLVDGVPFGALPALGVELVGGDEIAADEVAFVGRAGSDAFVSALALAGRLPGVSDERDPQETIDDVREERDERVGHVVEGEEDLAEDRFLESEGVRLDPEDERGRPLA